MIFGTLAITQLLITSTTISFLSTAFVTSELFCGESMQYSDMFYNEQTFVTHNNIPEGTEECLIRIRDKIGNIYTKQIKL